MTKRIADDKLEAVAGGESVISRLDVDPGGEDAETRQKQGNRTGGGAGTGGEVEEERQYGQKKSGGLF